MRNKSNKAENKTLSISDTKTSLLMLEGMNNAQQRSKICAKKAFARQTKLVFVFWLIFLHDIPHTKNWFQNKIIATKNQFFLYCDQIHL